MEVDQRNIKQVTDVKQHTAILGLPFKLTSENLTREGYLELQGFVAYVTKIRFVDLYLQNGNNDTCPVIKLVLKSLDEKLGHSSMYENTAIENKICLSYPLQNLLQYSCAVV